MTLEELIRKAHNWGTMKEATLCKDFDVEIFLKEHKRQLSIQGVSNSLLEKYIDHVDQCEGTNFISSCNKNYGSDVKFSDEEIKVLEILS